MSKLIFLFILLPVTLLGRPSFGQDLSNTSFGQCPPPSDMLKLIGLNEIEERVFPIYLDFIKKKEQLLPPGRELLTYELYKLFKFIETEIHHRKQNPHEDFPQVLTYDIFFADKISQRVNLYFGKNNEVYFDLRKDKINHGAYKNFSKILTYGSWVPVAIGELISPNDHTLEVHQREMEILKSIQTLPNAKRKFFAETYVMGEDFFIQEHFDGDLFDHYKENQDTKKFTFEEKVKALEEISLALIYLQQLGIMQSDVKLDNILVKFLKIGIDPSLKKIIKKVAMTDFGLAQFPLRLLLAGKPPMAGLTPQYAPPEIFRSWIGKTKEEKKNNLYKRDVFSLSVMAAGLLRPELMVWLGSTSPCHQWDRGADKDANYPYEKQYLQCKADVLWQQLKDRPLDNADDLNLLLLKGLHPDPTQRPTLGEWNLALRLLLDLRQPQPQPEKEFEQSVLTKLPGYRGEWNQQQASAYLQGKAKGSFVLIPVQAPATVTELNLIYVGENGKLKAQTLKFSPKAPEKIFQKIEFYKILGRLTS